jgi:hypothetical protein
MLWVHDEIGFPDGGCFRQHRSAELGCLSLR